MIPSLTVLLALACTQNSKTDPVVDTAVVDETDVDGDGFSVAEGDCDDANPDAFVGAAERCDGMDNDCDGTIDEDVVTTWYVDADGDGFGDDAQPLESCEGGEGYSAVPGDCDDGDRGVYPGAAEQCDGVDEDCDGTIDDDVATRWYADADGDGFGDLGASVAACEAPVGHVADASDCDDRRAEAFPGADELCDEADNDCDGVIDEDVAPIWYADLDGDGHGARDLPQAACVMPTGYAELPDDCDDANAAVNPTADEVCNLLDDDCDGDVDEPDALDALLWYTDSDADGYGARGTGTRACTGLPGEVTNADDCNDADATLNPATTWYIDYDGDAYGSTAYRLVQCLQPAGYVRDATDCDDAVAVINPAGTETCNDVDDDCDGRIDDADSPVTGTSTWYTDADGDGYGDASSTFAACDAPAGTVGDATDCDDGDAGVSPAGDEVWYDGVDSDCDGAEDPDPCVELPGASTVAVDPSCAGAYATSGWSVVTEWTTDAAGYFTSGASYDQVMMTPAVANLTDDNGDGRIDSDDIPDLVFTTFTGSSYGSGGYLRVVSGDGSGVIRSLTTFRFPSSGGTSYTIAGAAGVAIGDLEGDGVPEIVTITTSGAIVALTPSGTAKWVYAASSSLYGYPVLGDMDDDGDLEVAVGGILLNANGSLRGTCAVGTTSVPSAMGDVDADGDLDLLVGGAVCTHTGATLWSSGRGTGYAAAAQLDADPQLEVISSQPSNTRVDALDHTGALLWSYATTSGGGPAAVADIDGDGANEVLVSTETYLTALEPNGTRKWRVTIDDSSSRAAGVSTFDLDGDGAAEVLHSDEHTLRVLDGATGTVLYANSSHESGTIREMPIAADVDADGQAEIVVASNDYNASGWTGLHVLGEANGRWASARTAFGSYAFDPGLFDEDGVCDPSGGTGTMRAQASWSDAPDGAANLVLNLLGVCEDCADNEVDAYVTIDNTGVVFAPEGTPIVAYGLSGTRLTEIGRTTLPSRVMPGERTAPFTLTLPITSLGRDGLRFIVDPAGDVVECDTTDNVATWSETICL